ncbi:ABC transporter permease [Helcococcus kunzii]|uniref:ABC transporter permease n=1 Tax=Helcococcus kunzii TaxID=40091 RepID=UPI001C964E32|nr:ABC transporter permease [Helcococcus kunzii]QZO76823.1 ABC transporter permease [Helcococcus kunzii]
MIDKKKFKWSNLFLIAIFILLYAPIIYLIVYSFNEGGTMNAFTGFTTQHYNSVFEDTRLITIVINTIIIALLSAANATVIGVLGALLIYYLRNKKLKERVLSLNNILLVMPDVMIGASFLILFTYLIPLPMGFWTVLLAHVAFNIPIVVLMVLPKIYSLNEQMILAAEDLGASDWQILNKIILPNIASGAFTGFFMALTYSLDDFAVTFFITGSGFSTLSVEIYSRVRAGVSLEINALSTLMFIASLILVVIYYFVQMKEVKQAKRGKIYE